MIISKEHSKFLNKLTKESPYYHKFNQIRYTNIKGYIQHDDVILDIARCLTCYQFYDGSFFEEDFTHRNSLIVFDKAYKDGFSSYWLANDLFSAFTKTKLPDGLEHLERVIPVGLIMLPPVIRNPDGQLLKWVMFYHRKSNETIPTIKVNEGIIDIITDPVDTLTWSTMLDDNSQYSVNIKIKEYNTDEINDKFYLHELYGQNTDTQTEQDFTNRVTALIIQILLYLQLRPEEITPHSTHGSPKQKSKKQKRSPLIIGKNYQYKREKESNETGLTKATHWRRGFYRWQPYGKKENPEHKLIWIEPTLVNG